MTGVEIFVGVMGMFKQAGIYVGAAGLVWKTFTFLKAATDTAKQIPTFMSQMTSGMEDLQTHARLAVTNHLTHIESGVTQMGEATGILATSMQSFHESFGEHVKDNKDFQTTVLERLPEN